MQRVCLECAGPTETPAEKRSVQFTNDRPVSSRGSEKIGFLNLPPEIRERVYDGLLNLKRLSEKELDALKQGVTVQTLVEPLERARASGNYKEEKKQILADYNKRVRKYQKGYLKLLGDFADDKMKLMQDLVEAKPQHGPTAKRA
jgi:hypothetical protein